MSAKKKRHNKKHNSTSEDVPSVSSSRNRGVQSSNSHMAALFKRSVEKCDFCDQVFNNKYCMLVHNAKHIIIPLLKKTYHQCPECLQTFDTVEQLDGHTVDKHPNIKRKPVPDLLTSLVTKEPAIIVNNPIEVNKAISTKESLLQSFVKRQPVTLLMKEEFSNVKVEHLVEISDDDTVKSDFETESITMKSDFDDDETVKSETDYDDIIAKLECENEYGDVKGYYNKDLDKNKPRIKDRLMFEDDDNLETDGLLNDLTTSVTVNLEMFDGNWINGIKSLQNGTGTAGSINSRSNSDVWKKNAIILGNKPNIEPAVEQVWESVHFDELTQPGVFKCNRCDEEFGDRYSRIVHETSHITLKWRRKPLFCRYCDWYISTSPGGLYRHMCRKHPDSSPRRVTVTNCKDCGLNYVRLHRHLRNYHNKFLCTYQGCDEIHESREALEAHKCSAHGKPQRPALDPAAWMLKTVSVCDLCYSFFKNKANLHYDFLGEKNEVGKRVSCERCQKNFFSLNIVQLKSRKLGRPPITEVERHHPPKKKPCSNSERLKSMQQRLKKLKWLNKF